MAGNSVSAPDESSRLSGRVASLAWPIWWVVFFVATGLFFASVPVRFQQLQNLRLVSQPKGVLIREPEAEVAREALARLGLSTDLFALLGVAFELAMAVVYITIGLTIVRRRSDRGFSLLMALSLVLVGTMALPTTSALTSVQPWLAPPVALLQSVGLMAAGLVFFLFPDGRFVPAWARYAGLLWVVWHALFVALPGGPWSPFAWPPALAFAVWFAWLAAGIWVQVYRFRRVADRQQQQQTKWAVYGWIVAAAGMLLVSLPAYLPGNPGPVYELLRLPAIYLFLLLVPLSMGMAILRYRLWDIDLIINRTLVYVPLTAILGGFYSASINLSQRVFVALTGERSDAAIVITTLVVASAFTNIRAGLQSAVDKRFKEAPDPTQDLRVLGAHAQAVLDVVDFERFTRIVLEKAVAALQAEGGAIHLNESDGVVLLHTCGDWRAEDTELKVLLEGTGGGLGTLSLGRRVDGLPYSARDREALTLVAAQVAQVAELSSRHFDPRRRRRPAAAA